MKCSMARSMEHSTAPDGVGVADDDAVPDVSGLPPVLLAQERIAMLADANTVPRTVLFSVLSINNYNTCFVYIDCHLLGAIRTRQTVSTCQ